MPDQIGLFRKIGLVITGLAAAILPGALPAAVQAQEAPEYRINSGDELEIFVWGDERMQRPARVLPDGTFAFPLAGTVEAQGHTAREIAQTISKRLEGAYRGTVPDVTVSVKETAGMRFYVVGKVRTPGSYSSGRSINVVQALSLAGGPAEFADVDNAVIMRETPRGGQTVERVRLAEVLKGAKGLKTGTQNDPLPVLQSGDVLVIP